MGRLGGRFAWVAIVTAAVVMGPAVDASAQGWYYKEIHKDGRIYVFNHAEDAARFEQSGELGRGALTQPGTGPNGESVIGDSARALQLFYFKHGIVDTVPQPPAPRIEWRDGKTRITTEQAYLEISNRVQVRYTHDFPSEHVTLPGTDAPGDSRGSFRIRRAKLKLEGWFWRPPGVAPAPDTLPRLSYEVQMNWPAAAGSNVGAFLEDANLAWDPEGRGRFRVLFGQFKVPFGRQELTSSGNQQFVDRSLTSNEFARGRDTGVAVQGALASNTIEYRAGIFNGNGLTRTTNDNASFQVNARVMWQPNGSQPLAQRAWVSGALYSEADFESTTTPLYAVALSFEHNDFHNTTSGDDLASNVVGVDGVFKYRGFSATGEYYARRRKPETAPSFDSNGGFLQFGMMLNRLRTWEGVFRFGQRDVSSLVPANDVKELRGGINYYYRRHALKFQADFGRIELGLGSGQESRKDHELRMQAQFIF